MAISIEQIKSLREKTGVSTMACKKALEEAGGDIEKAIEHLRKKGEAKAAERSERSTSNGVVAVSQKDNKAAMISLACETDFVAKNADFLKAAQNIADKLLEQGEDADISNELSDLNIQMGEKVVVKEKKVVEGANISPYVHMNNKIGVLVSLNGGNNELGKDIAMHIAAMNPLFTSPEEMDDSLVAKEKDIWSEQLKQEGKPENIIEKIMEGKEKKFREESALISQAFVKDPDKLIKDLLGDINVEGFWRFEV